MNPKLIVIDGKTYKSVDEMPEDVRRNYELAMNSLKDENKNLIPDAFENLNALADKDKDGMRDAFEGMASMNIVSSTKIIADGKEYNNIEELPAEVRAKYDQAMGALDANRNGVPDFMEGMVNGPEHSTDVATSFGVERPRLSPLHSSSPTIEPESTSSWTLALLVTAFLAVCGFGAVGVWYFFLR